MYAFKISSTTAKCGGHRMFGLPHKLLQAPWAKGREDNERGRTISSIVINY